MRKSSLAPTEFLTQATCLALLRKHRIGLPTPRKPFQEFKAFLRRYKNQSSGNNATRATYSTPLTSLHPASGAAASAASDPSSGSEAAPAVEHQPPQAQPQPLPPGVNSFDTILQAIIEE
jgi:hypothetical protein